jgi:hypothetical protein
MDTEGCAYRHCREVFAPRTEDHRFCSQRCREAYAYDLRRAKIGVHGPRKRRLATTLPGCMENGHFSPTKTVSCKQPQPSRFAVPVDLLGRGLRWPGAHSLDRCVYAEILWREVAPEWHA